MANSWRKALALAATGSMLLPAPGAWAQTPPSGGVVAEARALFHLPASLPVAEGSGGGPGIMVRIGPTNSPVSAMAVFASGGQILFASNLPPLLPGEVPNLISVSSAAATAAAFARQVAAAQLPATRLSGPRRVAPLLLMWRWDRQVNGLPVLGQGLDVVVSMLSGRVVGVSHLWQSPSSWPSPTPAHPASWLDAQLQASGQLQAFYNSSGKPVVGLTLPGMSGPLPLLSFSARTGLPVGPGMSGTTPATGATSITVNPAATPFALPHTAVTQAEARTTAAAFLKSLGVTNPLQSQAGGFSSFGMGNVSQSGWSFQFGSSQGPQGSVSVDRQTGLVVQYQSFPSGFQAPSAPVNSSTPPASPPAAAVTTAEHFLASLPLPAGDGFLPAGSGTLGPSGGWMLSFRPVGPNGVPVDAMVQVGVATGGQVTSFTLPAIPRLKPLPAGFSLPAAQAAWQKSFPLTPAYEVAGALPFGLPGASAPTAHLVYTMGGSGQLNARTLKPVPLPYGFGILTQGAMTPAKTRGTGLLGLLQQSGAVPAAVYDSTAVTRGAASRFLLTLKSATGLYPPTPSPQGGVIYGTPGMLNGSHLALLKGTGSGGGTDPRGTLTRQEAAVLALRLLNYPHAAALGGSVRLPYGDAATIAPWARGAVGIATGLGLFKGEAGGRFVPDATMTWSQMATLGRRLLAVLAQRG